MFCEKCGAQLNENDVFCQSCGEKVPTELDGKSSVKYNNASKTNEKNNIGKNINDQNPNYDDNFKVTSDNPYHPLKDKEDAPKKGGHKKVVAGVVSGIAAAAVVTGGIITYNVLTSPAYQTARLINEQKYDEAFEMYANSDKEPSLINKVTDSLLSKLESIKNDFKNKKLEYEDAKNQLEEISQFEFDKVKKQLSDISSYVDRMQESFTSYTNGKEALSQERYSDAIAYLKNVVADDPDYDDAVKSLDDAINKYSEKTLNDADELSKSKDYKGALTKLKAAIDEIKPLAKNEEHKPLEEKYNEYKKSFVEITIEQAKEETKNKNYDKATSIINEALNIVSDEKLTAELSAIDEVRPVKLEELTISESDNFTQITDLTPTNDVVGNTYSPDNLFQISASAESWGSGYEGYADYYLNYKYKKLQGKLAIADTSDTTNATLTIYGDKKIIWTSKSLSRTTAPIEFDVDISKVDWLEFKLTMDEEAPVGTMNVLLSDLQFTK